jgi:hypothetical protein
VTQDDLQQLVRRRLFELLCTPRDAARRAQWALAPETIEHLARGRYAGPMSERLARAIAHALDVQEYRVRRVVGLPVEELADDPTRPHLRLIRGGCDRPAGD